MSMRGGLAMMPRNISSMIASGKPLTDNDDLTSFRGPHSVHWGTGKNWHRERATRLCEAIVTDFVIRLLGSECASSPRVVLWAWPRFPTQACGNTTCTCAGPRRIADATRSTMGGPSPRSLFACHRSGALAIRTSPDSHGACRPGRRGPSVASRAGRTGRQ